MWLGLSSHCFLPSEHYSWTTTCELPFPLDAGSWCLHDVYIIDAVCIRSNTRIHAKQRIHAKVCKMKQETKMNSRDKILTDRLAFCAWKHTTCGTPGNWRFLMQGWASMPPRAVWKRAKLKVKTSNTSYIRYSTKFKQECHVTHLCPKAWIEPLPPRNRHTETFPRNPLQWSSCKLPWRSPYRTFWSCLSSQHLHFRWPVPWSPWRGVHHCAFVLEVSDVLVVRQVWPSSCVVWMKVDLHAGNMTLMRSQSKQTKCVFLYMRIYALTS